MNPSIRTSPTLESAMTWTTPTFTEMRFGFEVTMYIQNR
ncbi:MAG TPA: pyrroloquinoline quinone precursor peptide PqqA [Planctomycetota bacterium]|jgi:coenzyme PQQ precursor peptide PqqA|nr:pyrroloquinoline quinone precursor peptide PqqA [Planctomycetota bacterium]